SSRKRVAEFPPVVRFPSKGPASCQTIKEPRPAPVGCLTESTKQPRRLTMSDPRYRDPRFDPPPLRDDDIRSQRLNELESSNAMWGWIAGAVVLALVLMFVFTRGQVNDTTASNVPAPP